MPEYVTVTFPTNRLVWIRDKKVGYTNEIFTVETGHHTFNLGPYKNYTPEEQTIEVTRTLPNAPMIIVFTRKGDGPEGEEEVAS